ncbi:(2Fe-2S)-binding protein [Haloferax mediterranei ATCC 33500]|uniref:(2Fe-2S)-binding protein n=1 Tax=Haloferax mediterranei (strain ATCC 33500 / DSM 1411 / JCM 8866 / NBRC 14739 / NCIMB 2177 / R-4) TaxID=523841 RepID=I3R2C9_HALMT|nr:Rieske 2Fe-2S domain-containing protein [Haloferax mediterranei]AFK18389.1 oxidoreductase [Haloferax mediterranei ATCC 33500]AHZ22216.1 (2Fe-2S)-binding protein [Haloferax mediterranei ATCC 33500]EMA02335.1 oxidoreductase [Haloferax mediterranei ATCC 33500]MDX5988482.1 Rieske 2Fe-2S domain-containing protein [Haloferax mediterranei ATCC 33500]QCQ74900.1 (2Fe-2S)-binding protein [Haloferax mediterranei ATCC 33500]
MSDLERICSVDDVPEDTTFLFRVCGDDDEEREAILVRTDDGIQAWLNYCMHLTHIKLDKGSGATMRNGEVICENHGAYFEADTGYCNYGPCEGAVLDDLDLTIDGDHVFLSDDDFSFVGTGPIETDPVDRSSSSNVEF